MLSNIVSSCFPELSARRLREVEAVQHSWVSVLPVFYCELSVDAWLSLV